MACAKQLEQVNKSQECHIVIHVVYFMTQYTIFIDSFIYQPVIFNEGR